MFQRGIRGAITLEENTKENIKSATVELLGEILKRNDVNIEDISFVIFTLTRDINADFPAKYARESFDFKYVPMMCYNEADIDGAINMCLRILVNFNTNKKQEEIKHIYLKGAERLRQDLK